MPATPSHLVRRADGRQAGALFDLPHQGQVCLHVEDEELARLLVEHGIEPARPPFLDAVGHGVRGAYEARSQQNWFLAPPLEGVVAALGPIFSPAGYSLSSV